MTVKEFILTLKSLKDDIQEKEIIIYAPNDLEFEPKVKCILKDKYDCLNYSGENIEKMVITYE